MASENEEEAAAAEEQLAMPTSRAASLSEDEVREATKDYQEAHRDAVRWLYAHMRQEGLTLAQTASLIHKDASTIHRVFRGRYGASLDGIIPDIESLRKIVDERQAMASPGFVETSTVRKIWEICEGALISNSIAFIYGDSQIGKTAALEEYARRNNHGRTRMFRMPATAGVQLMAKQLAESCNIYRRTCFDELRAAILRVIDHNTLVIGDEIHQTFQSYHKQARVTCLEFLREIHDRTKCGLVLCGTNVLRDEIQRGKHKEMLDQLRRRGVLELPLPSKVPARDVNAIARSYGLPAPEEEAAELVKTLLLTHGIGKLIKFLQWGARLASKRSEKPSWAHVIRAHDIIVRLALVEK